jgi:hypothetical protein
MRSQDATKATERAAPSRVPVLLWVLLALACLVTAYAFYRTLWDAQRYPGVDLRARVIGARQLLAGQNPYLAPQPADVPERLRDPVRMFAEVSRCTYPPPLLMLYAALAWMDYPAQRMIWMVLEWLALLASIGLLAWRIPRVAQRVALVCVALGGLAFAYMWRLHVERGQYYVFVLLLMAVGFWLDLRRRHQVLQDCGAWWSGVFYGLAAALRPSLLVLAVALWCTGLRRSAYAMVATLALVVLALLPWAGPALWRDYGRTVTFYEHDALTPEVSASLASPAISTPPRAEGYNYTDSQLPAKTVNITVGRLLVKALRVPPSYMPLMMRLAALAFIAAVAGLGLRAGARWPAVRPRLALAAWAVVAMDYLVPLRFGYADVLLLAPVGLLWPMLAERWGRGVFLWMVVGAWAAALALQDLPTLSLAVRSAGVMLGCAACLAWCGWDTRAAVTPSPASPRTA